MKKCGCCQVEKPEESFAWQNKAQGKRSYQCRLCQSADRRRHRNLNGRRIAVAVLQQKRDAIAFVGGLKRGRPCSDCGVSYPPYVMDFDHRDPSTKLFGIGEGQVTKSFDELKAELAKCDLVCANCHRERTHGPLQRKRVA